MRLRRFRIRTLMIAVAVVGLISAVMVEAVLAPLAVGAADALWTYADGERRRAFLAAAFFRGTLAGWVYLEACQR